MIDGLKPATKKQIMEVLTANPRVERVVLFGSRAMGTYSATSDIDIALFGSKLTLDDHANLLAALEGLSIAQTVDLVLINRVESKSLLSHVEKHGVYWSV